MLKKRFFEMMILLGTIAFALVACAGLVITSGSPTASPSVTVTPAASGPFNIGDTGPGGGIIFYVNADGFDANGVICHYLEAAPSDMGTKLKWNSSPLDIPNTSRAIGAGKKNTSLILSASPSAPAALACKNYSNNGLKDWFLPSRDELKELYQQRTIISGFTTSGSGDDIAYWASSQDGASNADYHNFSNNTAFQRPKISDGRVRAIRAF
jgi:hypothetical protein